MNYEFQTILRNLVLEAELKWNRTGDESYRDQWKAFKKVENLYKKYH